MKKKFAQVRPGGNSPSKMCESRLRKKSFAVRDLIGSRCTSIYT